MFGPGACVRLTEPDVMIDVDPLYAGVFELPGE